MRKMKKLFAVVLSLVIATAMLSACTNGSNGNTGNNTTQKPTDEPTTTVEQPTTEVTQTPDVTEEPTVTTEPQQTEGEIIPLFPDSSSDQIHQLGPLEFAQYSNFISLFNAYDSGKVYGTSSDDNVAAPLYTTDYVNRSFELGYPQSNGTAITVTLYYVGPVPGMGLEDSHVFSNVYYEIEGGETGTLVNFEPLYYNSTKQCLIAYMRKAGEWSLYEIYWDGSYFTTQPIEDLSLYGF